MKTTPLHYNAVSLSSNSFLTIVKFPEQVGRYDGRKWLPNPILIVTGEWKASQYLSKLRIAWLFTEVAMKPSLCK